jgi:hypothetical protein
MARKVLEHDTAQAPPRNRVTDHVAGAWPVAEVADLWMPWMNLWMRSWSAMLGPYGPTTSIRPAPTPLALKADLREPDAPWVPKIESTVIPFRRRDDRPGMEATKLSMRMRVPSLPWVGGSNVISIDTVMPHPKEEHKD